MAPDPDSRFVFRRSDGTPIRYEPINVAPGDQHIRDFNAQHGVHPTDETPVPDWDGRHPDYPLIIDHLLYADGRLHDSG